MSEGASIGLMVVLAIVIFGIVFITVYLLTPKTEDGATVFREGAYSIMNGQESISPRAVGSL